MLWRNIRCWLAGWKRWRGGGNDLIRRKSDRFWFGSGLKERVVFFFLAKLEVFIARGVFFCFRWAYTQTRRNRYSLFEDEELINIQFVKEKVVWSPRTVQ